MGSDYTRSFMEESPEFFRKMVNINSTTPMEMARICLPSMLKNKSGMIWNVSSMAGRFPAGLHSIYSASKAFIRNWSIGLAQEIAPEGIKVQTINAFYISTAMTKNLKTNFFVPSAKDFVFATICYANLDEVDITPYPSHAWIQFLLDWLPVGLTRSVMFKIFKLVGQELKKGH